MTLKDTKIILQDDDEVSGIPKDHEWGKSFSKHGARDLDEYRHFSGSPTMYGIVGVNKDTRMKHSMNIPNDSN